MLTSVIGSWQKNAWFYIQYFRCSLKSKHIPTVLPHIVSSSSEETIQVFIT